LASFLDETGANTFANLTAGQDVWDRFGVTRRSTYVYINDDGTWRTSGYGSLRDDVEDLISS